MVSQFAMFSASLGEAWLWLSLNIPITPKERLLLPLHVSHPKPRTPKRSLLQRLLRVVIQSLLVTRTVRLCHDIFHFLALKPGRQYFDKKFRLTHIYTILPHLAEEIDEDVDEVGRMILLDDDEGALGEQGEDGEE